MIASAVSAGTRSLRGSRSLSARRATAAATTMASTLAPPFPSASRSLVSTVLLSRDAYDKQNVSQLKDECRKRKIPTSGRRAEIIARLLNDDAKQNGSELRQEEPDNQVRSTHSRSNSSLASFRGKDAASSTFPTFSSSLSPSSSTSPLSSNAETASPSSALGASSSLAYTAKANSPVSHYRSPGKGASILHPEAIKPGQIAHSGQQQSAGQGAIITTLQKFDPSSNPPGVPPQKEPSPPTTFKVQVPYEQAISERGPDIPVVTMYMRREPTQKPPIAKGPRVVTASSATDVSHALEAAGLEPLAAQPSAASLAFASASKSLRDDMGLKSGSSVAGAQIRSMLRASGVFSVGLKASEAVNALVQDAALAFNDLGQSASAQGAARLTGTGRTASTGNLKRPLNAEEKRGLYILGGIFITGFAVGGLGLPSSSDKHAAH